jgi:hypothetical protein
LHLGLLIGVRKEVLWQRRLSLLELAPGGGPDQGSDVGQQMSVVVVPIVLYTRSFTKLMRAMLVLVLRIANSGASSVLPWITKFGGKKLKTLGEKNGGCFMFEA